MPSPDYRQIRDAALTGEGGDDRTASASPSTPDRNETIVAYVSAPGTDASGLEMVHLGSESNPEWLVLQHNTPVAKIALSRQQDSSEISDLFHSRDWANSVMKLAHQVGLDSALKMVKAEVFAAAVTETAAFNDLREAARASIEDEIRGVREAALSDLTKNWELSLNAHLSNFISGGDPLREALFENMKATARISDADLSGAIENAFRTAGMDFFRKITGKAEEYSTMAPEALSQIVAAVDSYGYRPPRPAVATAPTAPKGADPSLWERAASDFSLRTTGTGDTPQGDVTDFANRAKNLFP